MKKLLLTLSFIITITYGAVNQSHAAVAGVAAIVGAPAVSSTLAIAGLSTMGAGTFAMVYAQATDNCSEGMCGIYLVLGLYIGLIVLDESAEMTFSEVLPTQYDEIGITSEQAQIYNAEIEEVNILFSEVSNSLNKASSLEDSKVLWNQYKSLVSEETYEVMQKLAAR